MHEEDKKSNTHRFNLKTDECSNYQQWHIRKESKVLLKKNFVCTASPLSLTSIWTVRMSTKEEYILSIEKYVLSEKITELKMPTIQTMQKVISSQWLQWPQQSNQVQSPAGWGKCTSSDEIFSAKIKKDPDLHYSSICTRKYSNQATGQVHVLMRRRAASTFFSMHQQPNETGVVPPVSSGCLMHDSI